MKKMIQIWTVAAAMFFAGIGAAAQTVITSENVPSAGTNYIRGIDNQPLGIDPGVPGPGQTWDFTSLVADEIIGYAYTTPSATPFPDHFPGANLALQSTDTAYSYLYYDPDVYELQGVVVEAEGEEYVFDYIPDMIVMNFPFGYGNQFSQDYFFEWVFAGTGDSVRIKNYITKSVEADAFGTVTLPAGTFNALRASVTQISKDSTWAQVLGNWMLISTTISTTNYYEWYTDDPAVDIMLVSLTYDESWSNLESAEYFRDSFVGIEPAAGITAISVYPNPANEKIYLEGERLSGGTLQIFNMTGEKVREQKLVSGKEEIDIHQLGAGTYLYRVLDRNLNVVYQEKLLVAR